MEFPSRVKAKGPKSRGADLGGVRLTAQGRVPNSTQPNPGKRTQVLPSVCRPRSETFAGQGRFELRKKYRKKKKTLKV